MATKQFQVKRVRKHFGMYKRAEAINNKMARLEMKYELKWKKVMTVSLRTPIKNSYFFFVGLIVGC